MLARLVPATGKRNNTVPIMIVIVNPITNNRAFCLAMGLNCGASTAVGSAEASARRNDMLELFVDGTCKT